ncbi:MAG TPA: rhodanese-like domain-containing protein [Chitinophagaceae bacterium]|nr:rhodanese-like domain-containing protein [Chitinophagaceae bacterium]
MMLKIDKNVTIVDVRSPDEYSIEHVPGAINIPLDRLESNIAEFKKMPKPVIIYCRSGFRSETAVSILKQNGITEVIDGGGILDMLNRY